MYLVHARLRAPDHTPLPPDAAQLFLECALDGEGLEHVSAHGDATGGPVVGFYLTAPSLAVAEQAASAVCHRALLAHPSLAEVNVVSFSAALVPPHRNALPRSGGRDMQMQDPSTTNLFHPF
ncbi:hypothetical protein [Kitasatospora sp. MAP5-34]|uniref:hypothetical protein n=1 Tax=Kitasatospora sp. MAP5-34 TaxID=3035102 RepID=UPI0024757499|nr:hypothetical protein [Kitasatospora sp. MAP5-34]MDH6576504.1 hypothetical protein [Kitasatospora sp. MAP5-34]